jgi:hypothetical protein
MSHSLACHTWKFDETYVILTNSNFSYHTGNFSCDHVQMAYLPMENKHHIVAWYYHDNRVILTTYGHTGTNIGYAKTIDDVIELYIHCDKPILQMDITTFLV